MFSLDVAEMLRNAFRKELRGVTKEEELIEVEKKELEIIELGIIKSNVEELEELEGVEEVEGVNIEELEEDLRMDRPSPISFRYLRWKKLEASI